MDKNRFKELLTDLYEKYNKGHLIYVDELVQRNHDSPFPAIDSIFLKYNHKNMPHYDPVKSTDQYKIELLKDYEAGRRTFRDVDLVKEATEHKEESEEKQVLDKQEEVEKLTDEKVNKATKEMLEKVSELMAKEVDASTKKAIDDFRKFIDDGVDYTITMDNLGEDVILPNKRHLASLGINARLIVRTVSGKAVGLVIKDIAYDSFSLQNKVIVSIHLEKG